MRLWRVGLDAGTGVKAELRGELSADEVARAEHLVSVRDRERFVVTRGTLRALLGSLLGERPRSVQIEAGPSGKPRLGGVEHGLRFNVSHAGDLALIGITDCGELGVDLEAVRPVPSAVGIARRRFAPAEARFVEDGGPTETDRRFLLCWTRKEALVKAVGAGLDFDLRSFTVPLAPGGGMVSIGDLDGDSPSGRWLLVDVPLGAGHMAALALSASAMDDGASPARGVTLPHPAADLDHCEEIDVPPLVARATRPDLVRKPASRTTS